MKKRLLSLLILAGISAWYYYTENQEQNKPETGKSAHARQVAKSDNPVLPVTVSNAYKPSGNKKATAICSWNIRDLGQSKNAQEIAYMAEMLRNFDIVTIQEVTTSASGAQAVARLADELNRKGFKWDYRISDPTTGDGPERYAYLWKTARAKLVGKPWLFEPLSEKIDREPYLARFQVGPAKLLIASFHAVPTSKDPEKEIVLLDDIHHTYADENVLIMGDFNLDGDREAFNDLKVLGYRQLLTDQKTSYKMKIKDGEHLSQEYDNLFYEGDVFTIDYLGVIDFAGAFPDLKAARKISDHLPVWAEVEW
mgnify:CR=1 FL=1